MSANEWPDWADLPKARYTGEEENRIRRSASGEVVVTEIEYTRARRAIAREAAGERLAEAAKRVIGLYDTYASAGRIAPSEVVSLRAALAEWEVGRG